MTRILTTSRYKRLATAACLFALLLTFPGKAEAIPPPELVRIGSVLVQTLAVGLVFLSSVLFFLRRHLSRLFATMQAGRRILTVSTSVIVFVLAAWAAAAISVQHRNRNILADAPSSQKTTVVGNGAVAVAGMQLDITDPSFTIAPGEAAKHLDTGTHVLIDIREPVEFATRHVPGSINIRVGDLMAGGKFRQLDRDKKIVLLCEAGERGSAVAAFLRLKGYQALYVDKGIRGWIEQKQPLSGNTEMHLPEFANKYTKISPENARGLLASGKAILVDVRTPAEFHTGHVEGAVNIPLVNLPTSDLEQALRQLPREKQIIGIAYDRFGAYYCLIVGYLLDQQRMAYGGTLLIPPRDQRL